MRGAGPAHAGRAGRDGAGERLTCPVPDDPHPAATCLASGWARRPVRAGCGGRSDRVGERSTRSGVREALASYTPLPGPRVRPRPLRRPARARWAGRWLTGWCTRPWCPGGPALHISAAGGLASGWARRPARAGCGGRRPSDGVGGDRIVPVSRGPRAPHLAAGGVASGRDRRPAGCCRGAADPPRAWYPGGPRDPDPAADSYLRPLPACRPTAERRGRRPAGRRGKRRPVPPPVPGRPPDPHPSAGGNASGRHPCPAHAERGGRRPAGWFG